MENKGLYIILPQRNCTDEISEYIKCLETSSSGTRCYRLTYPHSSPLSTTKCPGNDLTDNDKKTQRRNDNMVSSLGFLSVSHSEGKRQMEERAADKPQDLLHSLGTSCLRSPWSSIFKVCTGQPYHSCTITGALAGDTPLGNLVGDHISLPSPQWYKRLRPRTVWLSSTPGRTWPRMLLQLPQAAPVGIEQEPQRHQESETGQTRIAKAMKP